MGTVSEVPLSAERLLVEVAVINEVKTETMHLTPRMSSVAHKSGSWIAEWSALRNL